MTKARNLKKTRDELIDTITKTIVLGDSDSGEALLLKLENNVTIAMSGNAIKHMIDFTIDNEEWSCFTAAERMAMLREAAQLGADYVAGKQSAVQRLGWLA
jgi:hypothetical protein